MDDITIVKIVGQVPITGMNSCTHTSSNDYQLRAEPPIFVKVVAVANDVDSVYIVPEYRTNEFYVDCAIEEHWAEIFDFKWDKYKSQNVKLYMREEDIPINESVPINEIDWELDPKIIYQKALMQQIYEDIRTDEGKIVKEET